MNIKLKFLHNRAIDTDKWDQVILNSVNSRVYALSWFLDILNPDWHGLIIGDYDYVMPVVFSKKWGIKYVYQPIYAQQHGIFPPSAPEITASIFRFLKERFQYIDISLNSFNHVELNGGQIERRSNYLLNLNRPYSDLFAGYSNGGRNNLKKANKLNTIMSDIPFEDWLEIMHSIKKDSREYEAHLTLKKIASYSLGKGFGKIYGAYSANNELTGAAFFLRGRDRYIFLCSSSTGIGKMNNSMFAILDTFIKDHAGQEYLLDFEGSNVPGIAYFFGCFGAKPEYYQHIKINRLPWPLKLFKR